MTLRRLVLSLFGAVCGGAAVFCAESTPPGVLTIPIKGIITEQRSREVVAQISGAPVGVHTIVVFVDSEGGALPDIFAVADALTAAKVTTFAYVKNAGASAVFIVASCERIVSDRAGFIGGAGVVSRDFLVLSDFVLSAVREELRVKLRGYSEQKHHDSDIFGAMLNHQSSLVRDGKQWKAPGQILSLTAEDMLALRLAESKWTSPQAFIEGLRKQPNKAPEPTPGSVTPRATERASK
jgi:membrane-bound ClpP family serine protease